MSVGRLFFFPPRFSLSPCSCAFSLWPLPEQKLCTFSLRLLPQQRAASAADLGRLTRKGQKIVDERGRVVDLVERREKEHRHRLDAEEGMRRGSSMARAPPKLEVAAELKVADGGGAQAPEMPKEVRRRLTPEQQGVSARSVPRRQRRAAGAAPPILSPNGGAS